jgi:hypothetical protein
MRRRLLLAVLLVVGWRVDLSIDDIRPKDDSGHGYWRTSAYVVGWRR